MGSYHLSGSANEDGYLKIMPGDCLVNDDVVFDGGPFAEDNGYAIHGGDNAQEMYCYKDIPPGWKVTAFKTYGNSGDTVTFYAYDITDTTANADGNTGTLNGLEITLATAVESSATNYVGIKINVNTVADFFYGGYFKIVKIQ